MVRIGNIELPDRALLLAPMECITESSFRQTSKMFGADMVYTEFVSSEGLIRDARKSKKKLVFLEEERPIGIQIYGHISENMAEAARLAEAANPDLIDINFGCPVKKVANRGAGAGILKDIEKMTAMTGEVVRATKLPVTVKTRLGWDEQSINIKEVAERLQDAGIQAITIHARTRSQMLAGSADWRWIGEVKNNQRIKIPVFGNGDIHEPEKAKEMFDRYGVDGIMIGRGSIGRPWIFKEIRHYLQTGEKMPDLSIREKVNIARIHFDKSIEWKGIPRGIYEMRRHFSSYFKYLPHFREYRQKLVTSFDIKEIQDTLEQIAVIYNEEDRRNTV